MKPSKPAKPEAQTPKDVTAIVETSAGRMTFAFFPDKAPRHVENFVKLAESGFYDGTRFHRVISGFMIQGGCPQGNGRGGPGYTIAAEFNDVHHGKGILSMARAADPDSAGSQFFVCHGDAGFLDGNYTAFGRLTAGEEVLDALATAPVKRGGENSTPLEPVVVKKVIIERRAP
jgi:peptidyl-prolyl cis-trans isomerase B (cyclophilin B)